MTATDGSRVTTPAVPEHSISPLPAVEHPAVEQSAVEQSAAQHSAATEQHAWLRMDAAWHLLHALALALAAVLVLTGGLAPAARWTALALLAVAACTYAATAGRAFAETTPTTAGVVLVAVACPAVVGVFVLHMAAGGVLLFTLYPHVWRVLAVRAAVVVTVLVSAAVAGVMVVEALLMDDPSGIPVILGWMGGGLTVALALGFWIDRVLQQSLRRAELVAELEATRAELADVSREAGALSERERLSREIHDTLAQGFTSILLLAQAADGAPDAAPALRRIADVAETNLAESRALVAALAPADLTDAGLPGALRRLVERFGDELGIAASVEVEGVERALPTAAEVVLLRVSQEALANVRKHAGARSVHLTLRFAGSGVHLHVRDDGHGFDPAEVTGGFGLAGIRGRVDSVGGTFAVRSSPGKGTCVEVVLR